MNRAFYTVLLLGIIFTTHVFSQDDGVGSISTDRPAQSETPNTVPKGYLQVEMGGYYQSGTIDSSLVQSIGGIPLLSTEQQTEEESWSAPNLLLKYGLTDWWELRLTINYMEYISRTVSDFGTILPGISGSTISTEEASGMDAPIIGTKIKLLSEDGWKPDASLSLHSKLSLWGHEDFKPDETNFQSRLTLGKSLTKKWFILVGGQYDYTESSNSFFYVAQTGYTFFEKLTYLIEFYGNAGDEVQNSAFNTALVYLVNDKHQLDWSLGTGLSGNYYDIYYAIGYSFRLNTASK